MRDIVDNPKKIKFVEVEAAQLPRSLQDVAAAVINGNYAIQAGLIPARDALILESAKDNPNVNILVTTKLCRMIPGSRLWSSCSRGRRFTPSSSPNTTAPSSRPTRDEQ